MFIITFFSDVYENDNHRFIVFIFFLINIKNSE